MHRGDGGDPRWLLRDAAPPAPGSPLGSPCLRLQLLGCCLATAQASRSWLMGKAFQYLAAWSLQQFLLVTQGDLQVGAGLGAVRGCAAAPEAV